MPETQAARSFAPGPLKTDATATGSVTVKTGESPKCIQARSNTVYTDVVDVTVEESADKEFDSGTKKIKYTVTLRNNSSVGLYGVKIISKLCAETALVKGSIVPSPQPGEGLETGVSVTSPDEPSVGSVPKGKTAVLQYEVTVDDKEAGDVVSTSLAEIKFRDQTGSEYTGKTEPSTTVTSVSEANLEVVETADKTFVTENGEEILFELVVKNTGNVGINEIVVMSPLPDGMNYKPNSTLKNGTKTFSTENPINGISIGNLEPAQTYKIQFSVTVSF